MKSKVKVKIAKPKKYKVILKKKADTTNRKKLV